MNLQFGAQQHEGKCASRRSSAYAMSAYSIKTKMGERETDSRRLETLVVLKASDGDWQIRHWSGAVV